MDGCVSRYWGRFKHLPTVTDRIRRVQLESTDALELVESYVDNGDALIYNDPPYPHEVREDTNAYGYEFDRSDHRKLATLLIDAKADVAISGYDCPLYEELYEDRGWNKVVAETKQIHSGNGKEAAEVLWTNYNAEEVTNEKSSQRGLTEF